MAAGRWDPGAGGGLPGSSGGLAGRAARHKTDGRTLLCRRPLQSETLPEGPSSHTKENATPETKTSRRRTLSHLGLSVGHSSAKTREPQGTTLRSGGGGAGAARVTISCMRGEGTGHRLGPVRARGVRQRPARGASKSVRPVRPRPPGQSGSSGNAAEARFVSAACLSYVSASPSSQTDPPRRGGAPAVKSIPCRKMCARNF